MNCAAIRLFRHWFGFHFRRSRIGFFLVRDLEDRKFPVARNGRQLDVEASALFMREGDADLRPFGSALAVHPVLADVINAVSGLFCFVRHFVFPSVRAGFIASL